MLCNASKSLPSDELSDYFDNTETFAKGHK